MLKKLKKKQIEEQVTQTIRELTLKGHVPPTSNIRVHAGRQDVSTVLLSRADDYEYLADRAVQDSERLEEDSEEWLANYVRANSLYLTSTTLKVLGTAVTRMRLEDRKEQKDEALAELEKSLNLSQKNEAIMSHIKNHVEKHWNNFKQNNCPITAEEFDRGASAVLMFFSKHGDEFMREIKPLLVMNSPSDDKEALENVKNVAKFMAFGVNFLDVIIMALAENFKKEEDKGLELF